MEFGRCWLFFSDTTIYTGVSIVVTDWNFICNNNTSKLNHIYHFLSCSISYCIKDYIVSKSFDGVQYQKYPLPWEQNYMYVRCVDIIAQKLTFELPVSGLVYLEMSMLQSMQVNTDFQTWHLIDWQQSRQPIRSHVRKSLLNDSSGIIAPVDGLATNSARASANSEDWRLDKTLLSKDFNHEVIWNRRRDVVRSPNTVGRHIE